MSSGKSDNESEAVSSSQTSQNIWQQQAPYLQNLFSGASGQGMNLSDAAFNQMNPQMMESWGQLMNPQMNPQLQAYQGDVQRNLTDNLLPAIQGEASMANQLGGSRQQIGEGLAVARSNQQISDMGANLYNEDMNRMLQAMGMGEQVGGFGMSRFQDLAGVTGSPQTLTRSQSGQTSESSGSSKSIGI